MISFTDRFGRLHEILMMSPGRFKMCARAYGSAWPAIRKHLAGGLTGRIPPEQHNVHAMKRACYCYGRQP